MDGYGVYKYTSGAIYYGEWKDGMQNGRVYNIDYSYLNILSRVRTNSRTELFMKANFIIIKCMVKDIMWIKMEIGGKVLKKIIN